MMNRYDKTLKRFAVGHVLGEITLVDGKMQDPEWDFTVYIGDKPMIHLTRSRAFELLDGLREVLAAMSEFVVDEVDTPHEARHDQLAQDSDMERDLEGGVS